MIQRQKLFEIRIFELTDLISENSSDVSNSEGGESHNRGSDHLGIQLESVSVNKTNIFGT